MLLFCIICLCKTDIIGNYKYIYVYIHILHLTMHQSILYNNDLKSPNYICNMYNVYVIFKSKKKNEKKILK